MKKSLLLVLGLFFSFICIASPPPPANEVFQVSVQKVDPNNFVVNWSIKPGFFLYSDRIKITTTADSNVHLGNIRFPTPLKKTNQQGLVYSVYRNQLALPIPVLSEHPGETLVQLHYQGCADDGFCYPPESKPIKLSIGENLELGSVELYVSDKLTDDETPNIPSNTVEDIFLNHHWMMILVIFFGFGLLLSFTPCVLPMVPVLSGIIIGHGHSISTRKAFFVSLSYVLSMAATYAVVGAIVAVLGSNLQVMMQSPWAIGLFSLLFVLLALSMFGYFELKLPVSWQTKLANANRRHDSGHYTSAAIMGCLSTLILSPCVTAPLIGALSYIAHSGNILMGGLSLFFLGLGMGTPLLLIGTSARRWLPKAGSWMNAVKGFFGALLLAVAIHLLSRILPSSISMVLWATLLIFSGVYMGALVPSYTHQEKFRQALGIMLLLYGLLILIGASMGGKNPWQPLAGTSVLNKAPSFTNHTAKNIDEVQEAIAASQGKPVMLDFYADWCTSCQVMETTLFKNPKVLTALENFVILKIDVTRNNADDKALLKKYHVVAPPTFVFFNQRGEWLDKLQLVGEVNSNNFLKHLQLIVAQK